jgi:hypothetical protein
MPAWLNNKATKEQSCPALLLCSLVVHFPTAEFGIMSQIPLAIGFDALRSFE